MSDTTDLTSDGDGSSAPDAGGAAAPSRRRRTGSGLSGMLLAELQGLASSLGITGTGRMRKGELIAAIQVKQASDSPGADQVGQVARPQKGTDVADTTGANQTSDNGSGVPAETGTASAQGTLPGTGHSDNDRPAEVPRRATRPAGPPSSEPAEPAPAVTHDSAGSGAGGGPSQAAAEQPAREASTAAQGRTEQANDGKAAAAEQPTAEQPASGRGDGRDGGDGRGRGERRERSRSRSGGDDAGDSGDGKGDSGRGGRDQSGRDESGDQG
ncbi:MAG: Rho termination factor N-terminal domain-containing protein, partial [Micromonosporaceae bacterium]